MLLGQFGKRNLRKTGLYPLIPNGGEKLAVGTHVLFRSTGAQPARPRGWPAARRLLTSSVLHAAPDAQLGSTAARSAAARATFFALRYNGADAAVLLGAVLCCAVHTSRSERGLRGAVLLAVG